MAQGALAWETRRTKGHISRSGTKGLKLRGQALRQVLRSQCGGITREGAGSTAASSSPSSVSVHRTSPDTEAVPVFAEHLPQGTTLRASCTSSPRILPATVREATGLQVEEQPRRCGRRWASPPGCPSGRPLPRALALPSPRSRSPFPTPHRMTRAAPQQTGLERIPEPHPSPQSPAIFQTAL